MLPKRNWTILSLCFVLIIGIVIAPASSFAQESSSVSAKPTFEKDHNFSIAKEIAESQLEEEAIVKSDGTIESAFKNAEEASVSEETFERFEQILSSLNAQVKQGNISFESSLFEMNVDDQYMEMEKDNLMDTQTSKTFYVTHSKVVKVQKLLLLGAGIAAVAAALGAAPLAIASAVLALGAAALSACDWNNKGVLITTAAPYCHPV